jgi:molybdopterin synthase sulfur carrier subunit
MKILYFARLKQIAGRGEEQVEVPQSVSTVSALIDFLSARDERVSEALRDRRVLKVAINQKHSALDANLNDAREVAFFPPVTGG